MDLSALDTRIEATAFDLEKAGFVFFFDVLPSSSLKYGAGSSIARSSSLSSEWPAEMLNTATFTEQGGKTTLTIRSVAINATEHERKIFEDGFKSMEGGFTGTLDQLAAYLAKIAYGERHGCPTIGELA
jgi:uncharacterized protein YndB with AHSA1/START domain